MSESTTQASELAVLVRSGKVGRDKVIRMLYQHKIMKAKAVNYVLSNSGTQDEAISVYGDSVLTLVKQIVTKPDWTISTSVENYLAGIVRYTWLSRLRKRKKPDPLDIDLATDSNDSALSTLISADRHAQLHATLSHIGNKCKEVLLLWANGYSMQEIADQCGYQSSAMAKKKKYKCLKALTKLIEQSPTLKERLQ